MSLWCSAKAKLFLDNHPAESLLLDNQRRNVLDYLAHLSNEFVAQPRDRLDKLPSVTVFSQRLS